MLSEKLFMTPSASQSRAITSPARNTIVVAGPGSGKTSVLVGRLKHLIETGTNPASIVAITFTNAAAAEIQSRLMDYAGTKETKLGYCGTLHGYALKYISEHPSVGCFGPPVVLSEESAETLLMRYIASLKYNGSLADLQKAIKSMLVSGPTLKRFPQGAELVAGSFLADMLHRRTFSFDGLIYWMLDGLRRGIGEEIDLLVDEFQDSAPEDLLAYDLMKCRTRFCVGDHDQAIYGFRGTAHFCIGDTARRPDFSLCVLEDNYRCASEICGAANALIAHNKIRLAKRTDSATRVEGEVEDWQNLPTAQHEMAVLVKDLLAQPDPTKCAVLLRTNWLVKEFSEGLAAASVLVAMRQLRIWPVDWWLAKIALSFLADPENDTIAGLLIEANGGEFAARSAQQAASLARQSINQFALKVDRCRFLADATDALLRLKISPESVDQVRQFVALAPAGADISALAVMIAELEKAALEEAEPGVTVCTMHAAKGREWDTVYLPAFQQEFIPGTRKDTDVEEERRLAFVAMTRARRRLVLSWSAERQLNEFVRKPVAVTPSQFVKEALR